MAISVTNASALVMLNALVDRCEEGTPPAEIKIYAGTVPTDADTALSGNTLLGTLTFSNPAFEAATDDNPGATVDADTITDDSSADATGTASFYRVVTGTAGTVLWQGDITATGGGGDMELVSVSITIGQPIQVSSFTMKHPE